MRLAGVLALFVLVALAGEARAGDPLATPTNAEAVTHWRDATKAIDAKDYDRAIAEYKAGALVEDLPFWDWNLANAHQEAGRLARARWYFERYISRLEAVANADEDVRHAIEAARIHLAEIDEAERTQRTQAVEPDERPDERPRTRTRGTWTTQRRIAVGLAAVGVVAAGVGTGFALNSRALERDAAAACPPGCTTEEAAEANALAERSDSRGDVANVVLGTAAVAIVGAAVLWFAGAPDDDAPSVTAIVPHFSPSYAGAALVRRF
jgi:hypothetical protein